MLRVSHLAGGYRQKQVLHDVNLSVAPGEVSLIIGPNGAGKSTVLKAITGLCRIMGGEVSLAGQVLNGRSVQENVAAGVVLVLQGGRVFPNLTVEENLLLGAYLVRRAEVVRERLQRIYTLFPRLGERQRQWAHTLSGGERQMVALGRSLMADPRLLLLDEPSLGLAPAAVEQILQQVREINRTLGTTILVVEQNVLAGLRIADRVVVLREGRTVAEVEPESLASSKELRRAFLSI